MLYIGDNLREFERALSDAMLDQLPFALARALNDTGQDVADAWRAGLNYRLDRPTPFTLRAPYIARRASKRSPTVVPAFRQIQGEYLRLQITGGTRRPTGSALVVPVAARLNQYGNMPRGYVRRLLASGGAFVASRDDPRTAHLAPGIYRRGRRTRAGQSAPQLLVAFEDRAEYSVRFDFAGIAERRALSSFPGHLSRRLQEAWGTRR
jgi:hypothetical protein